MIEVVPAVTYDGSEASEDAVAFGLTWSRSTGDIPSSPLCIPRSTRPGSRRRAVGQLLTAANRTGSGISRMCPRSTVVDLPGPGAVSEVKAAPPGARTDLPAISEACRHYRATGQNQASSRGSFGPSRQPSCRGQSAA